MGAERHDGRRRGLLVVALAVVVAGTLSGCALGQGPECGGSGGCAAVVSVPTSDVVTEDGAVGTGMEGTLRATVHNGRVCLYLDRSPTARAVDLVLPKGTRATPLGDLPTRGAADLRLLGEAGIGGITTGDEVRVSLDRAAEAVAVPGCAGRSTVEARWITTTRKATSSAAP